VSGSLYGRGGWSGRSGRSGRSRRIAVRIGLALIVLTAALAMSPATLAATPDPTSATIGDPRSSGQGPGLVGDPAMAIALVLLIGAASVAVSVAYLRFTARTTPARRD
jgi:hypothetical protein